MTNSLELTEPVRAHRVRIESVQGMRARRRSAECDAVAQGCRGRELDETDEAHGVSPTVVTRVSASNKRTAGRKHRPITCPWLPSGPRIRPVDAPRGDATERV